MLGTDAAAQPTSAPIPPMPDFDARFLAPNEEVEQDGEDHADDDRRHDREVESAALALDRDVAGKPSERQPHAKHSQAPDDHQQHADDEQNAADIRCHRPTLRGGFLAGEEGLQIWIDHDQVVLELPEGNYSGFHELSVDVRDKTGQLLTDHSGTYEFINAKPNEGWPCGPTCWHAAIEAPPIPPA